VNTKQEYLERMGEPPSSVAYLMSLMFDGEAVTVLAPRPLNLPSVNEGD
jgi:hypothetical protein